MDTATTRYYRQFRQAGYCAVEALDNARALAWADTNEVEFIWADDPDECLGDDFATERDRFCWLPGDLMWGPTFRRIRPYRPLPNPAYDRTFRGAYEDRNGVRWHKTTRDHAHEQCGARLGEIAVSLGCIDDATDIYRREIEAQLTFEIRTEREAIDAKALDLISV